MQPDTGPRDGRLIDEKDRRPAAIGREVGLRRGGGTALAGARRSEVGGETEAGGRRASENVADDGHLEIWAVELQRTNIGILGHERLAPDDRRAGLVRRAR